MTALFDNATALRHKLGARLGTAFRAAPPVRPLRSPMAWVTLAAVEILFLAVDKPLALAVRGLDPSIMRLAGQISQTGDSKWSLVPIGVAVLVMLVVRSAKVGRTWRASCDWLVQALSFVFAAVAGSGLLVDVIKVLIGRARPRMLAEGFYGFSPPGLDSSFQSFPSGHSNTLFALAVALGLLAPRWRGWLLVLAGAFALCRVGANAHYLSDVVAGGVLGVATTLWLRDWFGARGWVFVPAPHGGWRIAAPGRLLIVRLKRGRRR